MSEREPSDDGATTALRRRLAERRASLEQRRRLGLLAAVLARFKDIDGGTQATVLSVALFTTILPLIIIGFAFLSGFAADVSVGVLFDREVGLSGSAAETVRQAFGSAEGVRSSWTFIGIAGFLLAGIPMAVTVAGIFAKAWMRDELNFGQRLWRGVVWFLLYLATLAVHDSIAFGDDHSFAVGLLLFVVSLLPSGCSGPPPPSCWSATAPGVPGSWPLPAWRASSSTGS